ncbi:hypothetical protein ILUMI_24425 [Ignelater luminosus]|uniref:DUF4371 domain-containing protein n=1 Tax=Ignelater luminosus TaxID=2038154 RepID=A0A8K0G0W2_IGNLU|nr:hypothetical protein ILUMI_24425 [Ignelater luminosus]
MVTKKKSTSSSKSAGHLEERPALETALISKIGFKDWRHLSRTLERHEKSSGHLFSVKKYLDLKTDLLERHTVDSVNQATVEREKKRWTAVLERIIEIITFLDRQNLALRGTTEKLYESNNGNFLKLVECISNFDNTLSEHISRIQSAQHRMPHYLGHNIQNELINIISKNIKTTIVNLLKQSKYYSIILDCTPDISHKEQLTVIVSKSLQKSDVILSEAVKMLDQVKKDLATNRTDTAFEQLLFDSTSIAEELECETEFSQTARPCPQKRHFNYETADEPVLDPKQNFKINFYFRIVDRAQ